MELRPTKPFNFAIGLLAGLAFAWSTAAVAQTQPDQGVSNTTIKIGNTAPYSGPGSAFSAVAKAQAAYFKMINDSGGIRGRKIDFISYDDALSPPKTVEQVRKLVERDEVLAVFSTIGTAANLAVQRYLNDNKIPQLFIATGATRFDDPKSYPWTIPLVPIYQSEARIYAHYILATKPEATIAILSQNDDFGRDYVKGMKDGLGEQAGRMIVAEATYQPSDPTVDSQISKLRASGATVLLNVTTPKFAAQSIKKMAELQWKPMHLLVSLSISIGAVLQPAGLENAQGILSAGFLKDPSDKRWKDDAEMNEWNTFMDKYMPGANRADWNLVFGYVSSQALVQVLTQCEDDLSRANVMRQAANLKQQRFKLLLPGIVANTSSTDFNPLKQLQMMRFQGDSWEFFGPVFSAEAGN